MFAIEGNAAADGAWIKLTASDDGSFRIVNGRTGFAKAYARKR